MSSELIVKYPDRAPDHFPLGRLRITIGRSARNDLCIPDPFASRVHAEVRREGDEYVLQDLGSANGTLYNGVTSNVVKRVWEHRNDLVEGFTKEYGVHLPPARE